MIVRCTLAAAVAVCVVAGVLPATAAPVAVRDDAGATVRLPEPARRIVTLAPNATELVFAAGAGERIVGTVDTSDFPPAAAKVPRVGDVHALDLERIVALAPDLVVTWPYTTPAQVALLRARGIAVFTADPATIDGIAADLQRLGTLAATGAEADAAAAKFRARVALLRERSADRRRLRVFYEIWDAPLYTIGGRHLISEAIALCGGENVFAGLPAPAPEVSVEAVLAARPEVIIAGTDGGVRPAWLDRWRRWPDLPAARQAHLYAVDADLLHRDGPRFADGVASLCAALDAAR
jgi:iron complex transport system substrate-binding protein